MFPNPLNVFLEACYGILELVTLPSNDRRLRLTAGDMPHGYEVNSIRLVGCQTHIYVHEFKIEILHQNAEDRRVGVHGHRQELAIDDCPFVTSNSICLRVDHTTSPLTSIFPVTVAE